jgi:anti-sigma B factor antagonist
MIFQYKTKTQDSLIIFKLIGELIDKDQPKVMVEDIAETLEKGTLNILLNLKEVRYINSSGLTVLINILTKVNAAGGKLAICNVNDRIKELLRITKLVKKFNVCGTEEEGITLLNK